MRKMFIIFTVFSLVLNSCDKGKSPEGPTDIRIKNITDQVFQTLSVDTSGGSFDYEGTVAAGGISEYKRFEKAYPRAEVTVTINGEAYTTGTQNYNYQVVLGQGKFTYEVYIENPTLRKLAIARVIPEAPLD